MRRGPAGVRWRAWVAGLGAAIVSLAMPMQADVQDRPALFRPDLTTPDALAPFLAQIEPGQDAFPDEALALTFERRLNDLGTWLTSGGHPAPLPAGLLSADLRGSRLLSVATTSDDAGDGPLLVARSAPGFAEATLDARAFAAEFDRLVADMPTLRVAEFLVTALTRVEGTDDWRTDVRVELVGSDDGDATRHAYVGTWRLTWHRDDDWGVRAWVSGPHVVSRARAPIFRDVTADVVGAEPSVAAQLSLGLDEWMATLDAVLTRDSNGHHGIAVGDVDGDGLDDLYISQPAGLPNLLLRARGDGTFEDITARSGMGLLDDTAQALFADIDNDGDQDLVLATSVQPLAFFNDGTGRFTPVPRAFGFAQPLQGVLTGLAMADFDRDGFLDVYLCVYSYFFGAGEEKAGTPMPYHDARNGPPGHLFRNDGHGRFVDVTRDAGLEDGNDRYHFAATWGDYDNDGWPDLLVANDFGANNLYRNLGRQDGQVRFADVAAQAGVLDHAAGMSATFVDYDNDGHLDIYTGNMWSAPGQRVTASAAFLPDAPAHVRGLFQRHARGNSLFRNLGDGRFEDRTIAAGAAMGRWAWASDALDFDSDGWQDLYIVNGMLTRAGARTDLESFFWRQVVARSPLSPAKGTPYDDAWRAINQRLIHDSIASRQRNVVLRNDGQGGFDDVSGAVGLDLEQDGRAFAVLDIDRDGDPDLAVMAARQAPQLRVFRNEHPARSVLAIRLEGTTSNRDAIGARVRVETEAVRGMKQVSAGSGFLSQHSKELLFGLGASRVVQSMTVEWPSGLVQVFTNLPVDTRFRLVEGQDLQQEPIVRPPQPLPTGRGAATQAARRAPDATWLYEPFPTPDFSALDLGGATRSRASLAGAPAVVLLWRADVDAARAAVAALGRGASELRAAGIGALAVALDEREATARVRAAAAEGVPVVHADRALAVLWAIVQRHLFMNRQPLPLPTALLLDASGQIVRVYRGGIDVARVVRDAAALDAFEAERLARALPFPGHFVAALPMRNLLPFGRELLDEGLDAAAIMAFDHAARANPSGPTLYRLGTLLQKTGEPGRARAAFEQALALDDSLAEAHNDLGTLLAQDGNLEAAIARFRQALAVTPDYPDALNNLGYGLLLTGREQEARPLYERALALQPDFPEALNNLGLLLGRAGDLGGAERYFRDALARRADYGDAANNLALALVARGASDEAVQLLEGLIARAPHFAQAYVTLGKLHLVAGRTADGLRVLERLLQRNPGHVQALTLVREYRPR